MIVGCCFKFLNKPFLSVFTFFLRYVYLMNNIQKIALSGERIIKLIKTNFVVKKLKTPVVYLLK